MASVNKKKKLYGFYAYIPDPLWLDFIKSNYPNVKWLKNKCDTRDYFHYFVPKVDNSKNLTVLFFCMSEEYFIISSNNDTLINSAKQISLKEILKLMYRLNNE